MTRIVRGLFQVLMIGLPMTGWLAFAEFVAGEPAMAGLSMFGLFPVPGAPMVGDFVKAIRNIRSKIAMALIILHVLAALKHQFVNRDGLLRHMVPH